jgi:hypothetical protein
MLLNRINVFAFLVLFAGCIKPPIITPSSQEEASKAVNLEQARELSDSIAGDLVKDDRTYVRNAMERGFRDYYDEAAFSSFVDQLFSAYGKPLEVEYKMDELGRKTAIGLRQTVAQVLVWSSDNQVCQGHPFSDRRDSSGWRVTRNIFILRRLFCR